LRLDYAKAGELTAAILDWRDADDLPRINGGEKDEYVRDGAAMLPGNHVFSTIDELRFVKGMTDEIFAAARPFLVIRTSGRAINVNAAPEEVLLALPGMNPEGAATIVRQRRAGNYPRDIGDLLDMLPSSTRASIIAQGTGAPGGPLSAFTRNVTIATEQVEVIAEASVPGSPSHSTTQIMVDRALNGAAVTWRRVE
jgi:general secretion pathway protein K